MLSTEDTQPLDPHEISSEGVDLSIPSLDDHNSLSDFSIRDYVFNARSKDIKTNWPFSKKILKLCLKHGVKDILPPFQCFDSVKKQSSERAGVESKSGDKGKIINLDEELSNIVANTNFSGFECCDNQLPDTKNYPPQEVLLKTFEKMESHSPKKPEISNPPSMKKCKLMVKVGPSGVEPKTSEKTESHPPKKPEISKPPSMKKCKLMVKVGPSRVEPSSNLKTASKFKLTAASKVCPICKIFSSSSNTKLNAHIDQCLSVDSPIEPSSKSRMIKHRIKPRKTRLMVDIYASAKYCTLEELDRRNGRINWREKPSLPTIQEDKVDCGEEKNKSVGFDEKGDEGVVYIDSNGTKIRILNKISDSPSGSILGVNPHRLGKTLKGGKGSKHLLTFKKKKKHSKCLKLSSPRENTSSYKTRFTSRILGDREKDEPVEESAGKNENMDVNIAQKSSKFREQTDSKTIVPKGASSKRTDHLKRRFLGDPSSLHDLDSQKVHNSYMGKGIDNSSCEGQTGEYHEPAPLKKLKSFQSCSAAFVDGTLSSLRKEMLLVDKSAPCDPKLSKNSPLRTISGHHHAEKYFEHQHCIDEDHGQVPHKRSTILKLKKKKSPAITRNEFTPHTSHFEDGFSNEVPFSGGKIVIGQSSGTEAENVMSLAESFDQDFYSIGHTEMSPTDVQEDYLVDPITIPGPPGSFLPSPGRASSDEDHQVNSSLTTSQVQSSIDHFEIVDRDSSNSPKSLNSTVSNSVISRSDSKLTESLSHEPLVPQDEIIKLGFSDENTKSTLAFQDDQPCCHTRKEGISVNYQGSGPVSVKVPIKPPICGDFGSPSPSSPNPVLRLMGKNLMVFNNDENLNHKLDSKFQEAASDNHVHQVSPFCESLNSSFSPLGYNKIERFETLSGTNNKIEVHNDGKNVSQTSSGVFPISNDGYYNSSRLNPFYSNQGSDFSPYRGSHMIPNASLSMAPPSSGLMRWNNSVLQGSGMRFQNHLSSLPSTNHVRSSMYNSPSMQ